jgi:hypothetical protein
MGEWGRQDHGSALFDSWSEPHHSHGEAFLPRLADAIEAMGRQAH